MNKICFPLFALFLFCQKIDAQVDTVPPVLVCKNQVVANIGGTCLVTVWAADLVDTVYDNNSAIIELGLRKPCVGTGFPLKNFSYFTSTMLGTQSVELWARDNSGNTTSCTTTILVSTFNGSCGAGSITIGAYTLKAESIDSVKIEIEGQNCLADTVDIEAYTTNDWSFDSYFYCQECPLYPGYDLSIKASKDNRPLNGVTTYDLTLISKHILGIEPLDSPFKMIAADANQDGKVTTFDLIILRKLILGIIDELPNGKSWRFVPYQYVFPNPQNPFQPPFPEKIMVLNTTDPIPNYYSFKGVKIGDVDFSADPN